MRANRQFVLGSGLLLIAAGVALLANERRSIAGDDPQSAGAIKNVEVKLHARRAESGPLSGRVVLKDDPDHGVPEAEVTGISKNSYSLPLRAISDAEGRFQAVRSLSETVVHASTRDKKLAGILTIGADEKQVQIPIGPTSSAHGRLLDEASGQPLAERQVEYGVFIKNEDGTFGWRLGDKVTTDDRGEFTIAGLVVDQEYVMEAVTDTDGKGQPQGWRDAGKVTAASTEMVEMGDLKLPPPYHAPTTEERVAKAFNDERSLDVRLKLGLRDAQLGYQRVLLVVGDPKSSTVEKIFESEYGDGLDDANYDYLLMPVNTAGAVQADAVRQLLSQHSISMPENDDAILAVLDGAAMLVAETSASKLVSDGTLDRDQLISFLRANRRELPDAERLLADAISRAKQEDKRVFVQVSGPRCGWCFVLSRFLDDHHDIVDKEFIYVKLDSRLEHGQEVIDRVRPNQTGGIPWFVILDADANPLITSDGPNGNIGYPGEPEGQVHFEKMLRTSSKHLTDADISSLIADLSEKKN